MTYLKLYGITGAIFFAIDLVWLGIVAPGFYERHLGSLMRNEPLWPAALLFYGVYIAGIVVFAVLPSLEAQSLTRAVLLGGFLGLVAYATFDLTSLAVLRGFPPVVVVVDLVWGTLLTGSVAGGAHLLGRAAGLS